MSFRLAPKSVTLNDLERRNGVILRYFSALRKSSRSLSHLLMSSCSKLECAPMPNVMVALPTTGGAVCSTPQFG